MGQLISNENKSKLNLAHPANNQAQLGTKLNGIYYGRATMASTPLDVTLTGVEVGDTVVASVSDQGSDSLTLTTAICAANKITIATSAVTTGDGVVDYIVIKA
jgi:hypothetical protein